MDTFPIVTRDATGFYPADGTGNVEICRVGNWPDKEIRPYNQDRWMADARLISAAPEMLSALQQIARAANNCGADSGIREGTFGDGVAAGLTQAAQLTRVAIAKALSAAPASPAEQTVLPGDDQ